MKKFFTLLAVVLVALPTICSAQNTDKGLNQIRFDGWTEKEWQDNDYYREIRNYITDFQRGMIRNGSLTACKDFLDSKFLVLKCQPMPGGGLWGFISFLDAPDKMLRFWVYSYVDERREVITGYEVRSLTLMDEPTGFTKEAYLNLVANNPQVRLW